MSVTPPVEHPTRPGVWGVFLPYHTLDQWPTTYWPEEVIPVWIARRRPPEQMWIAQRLADYLSAHEFDVKRPFEVIELDNALGYGYFYVEPA